jgi:hypothetical protein
MVNVCTIPECGKPAETRGWCMAHYTRWRRHGDPTGGGPTSPRGEAQRYFREVVLTYGGDECLRWPYVTNDKGYGRVWQDGRMYAVNRLVCSAEHGPPPTPEHEAAHSCGKGHEGCCAKRHLSWKTPKENAADKVAHGTSQSRGGVNIKAIAKLSESDVRQIRTLIGTAPNTEIAKLFGVTRTNISCIAHGKSWAWLE